MYKDQKDCFHEKLTFGSGDFQLFCQDCGRIWLHSNNGSNEISYDHGQNLSGEYRVKFPSNLTFLECKYEENNKGK